MQRFLGAVDELYSGRRKPARRKAREAESPRGGKPERRKTRETDNSLGGKSANRKNRKNRLLDFAMFFDNSVHWWIGKPDWLNYKPLSVIRD